MNRFDFKFLLKSSEAIAFLNHLYREYDLIANNEIMIRSYETKYFDTYQRDAFLMHHKGKFPRYKIRTRIYLDTNDQFVEVKFKNNKGLTEKYRNKLSEVDNLFMQPDVISFLNSHNIHNLESLQESLLVNYQRISLKHKQINERITLDFNLTFSGNQKKTLLEDIVIIEVKQEKKCISSAMEILRSFNKRSISMSKYCYGISSTDPSIKHNNFKPLLKNIHKLTIQQ
jgi:hypothetical protein